MTNFHQATTFSTSVRRGLVCIQMYRLTFDPLSIIRNWVISCIINMISPDNYNYSDSYESGDYGKSRRRG